MERSPLPAHTLLLEWLKARLSPEATAWLQDKAASLAAAPSDKTAFTWLSSCSRHSGKAPLRLDAAALEAARQAIPGWNPSDWTCDQAARIFLLLALPPGPASAKLMDQMYQTADVDEAVALQKAVAVLSDPESHLPRAREALRSNIKAVFEAMALRNPYPALHFDDLAWNQMVVKTFFVDSPLPEIEGLDRRVNAPLSRMLSDLAEERWAAGRTFSPQLWRCVGPRADGHGFANLEKVLSQGTPEERRAAALALASCPDPRAATILAEQPALASAARDGSLTWENL